jgi:thiol-disulfide isomerase/thioredoxin
MKPITLAISLLFVSICVSGQQNDSVKINPSTKQSENQNSKDWTFISSENQSEDKNTKNLTYLSSIKQFEGQYAKDWTLKSTDYVDFNLSDFKGKVLLIEFTGPGCIGCVKVQPFVNLLDSAHKKNENFKLIALNLTVTGDNGRTRAYNIKHGIRVLSLLDDKGVYKQYGVTEIPSFFLIDKTGKIVYTHVGLFTNETFLKLNNEINKNL